MSSALTVAVAATTTLACTAMLTALSLIPATHEVRNVADAAALAAADSLLWRAPDSPCAAPAAIADRQGASLTKCVCEASSCTVTATRFLYGFELSVSSRAGCEGDIFSKACVW